MPQIVRLVISSLTDTRRLEAELRVRDIHVEFDQVSMADTERREYFRSLQSEHGWHSLPMVFLNDEFIGGDVELLRALGKESDSSTPNRVAWVLALAGLLPFAALAVMPWLASDSWVASLYPWWWFYGPVIVSFMAAIHWGVGLLKDSGNASYIASVIPALLGWAAGWLFTMGAPSLATALVLFAFVLVFRFDIQAINERQLPAWYGRLRVVLTIAVASLLGLHIVGLQLAPALG